MSTKFRIRNKKTGSYLTKAINSTKALNCLKKLDNSEAGLYELVSISSELEQLPPQARGITEIEKKAIIALQRIKFSPGSGHAEFANTLITKVDQDRQITERQSVYLWHLVYYYRRQIDNFALINEAKIRKIY